MYGISILAGKKHVKINAYHGTCKSLHACTAPEHATMGNVQHYTPAASQTPTCYATRSETRYRTPALAGVWYFQASSLHENLPDENTMKPRMKYGLPHTRSGRLLYMKTRPVRIRARPHMEYRYTAAQGLTAAQPSNIWIARVCGNL
ncbi:hypothetical protein BS47DRAFT_1369661, partial [Hydnum rufescens UP504]